MFVRYLGGGIGHLEQFPPAESDENNAATHNDGDPEVEVDDFNAPGDAESGDGDEGEEDEDGKNEEDEEDEEDEEVRENEDAENGDDLDPGESSDEETGNVY